MNWLAPDSKFMRAWSNLVDGVWINILMLVTSIPIITIGASTSALSYVTLPFLVALIALVWSWIVLQITPLLIIKFALTILWLIGFEWVFALQARFENTVAGTLKNAFIFGISHIAMTVALVIVDAVFVALLAASWFHMPGGLFLLVILGYGTMLMLHIPVAERVFKPYLID